MYDFNSISNRLLQADFQDHTAVVSKFVEFIRKTPIIYDFIMDCGTCEQDIKQEFDEVGKSYGRCIFTLGDTNEAEIRNVYAILCYISDNNIETFRFVAMGYSTSKGYQEKIKGFNDRVIMVLIRHIETYLTKIGIDMGLDEKTTYSITVHNGQVNIANDNASITATNSVGIDATQLAELVKDIRVAANGLSGEDSETLESSLEVVEAEATADKPRKSFIKTAISGLTALKGTAEFAAAVVALVQFLQPLL
jgi:hypothetical protein